MALDQLDFFARLVDLPLPVEEPNAVTPKPALQSGLDEALTAKCRDLLLSISCHELAERVKVNWSPRLRSTAGLAFPGKGWIRLNPRLQQFGEAEVDQTLRHELAHLLANYRVGRRRIAPHGPEWQKACADLGVPNEKRCHDLPLPRKEISRRHLYRCPGCKAEMKRVRPIRRPSACLACCRRHSGGRYDERFRFVKVPVKPN